MSVAYLTGTSLQDQAVERSTAQANSLFSVTIISSTESHKVSYHAV